MFKQKCSQAERGSAGGMGRGQSSGCREGSSWHPWLALWRCGHWRHHLKTTESEEIVEGKQKGEERAEEQAEACRTFSYA